jgi:hypothetical protein
MNQACWSLNNKLRLKWTVDICRPEEVFALSPTAMAAMAIHPLSRRNSSMTHRWQAQAHCDWPKHGSYRKRLLGIKTPFQAQLLPKPGLAFNFSVSTRGVQVWSFTVRCRNFHLKFSQRSNGRTLLVDDCWIPRNNVCSPQALHQLLNISVAGWWL